ncbi:FG-GAP-like repeat-containing protein [Hymenobacter terricola]|uniref:FG-GAP-like repeat-containing protein n=1 Tax=Hymenobacter terricola TaxID=2819236 RepID=UPI001B316390|nr:FG-GAP-like repeat-containing protein [Hymenobacter terricola]
MSFFSASDSLQTLRRTALAAFALFLPVAASAQTITSFTPTSATAGSVVAITGLSLGSATAVLLNGQSLKITSNTATAILVTIPVAASTGKLVVTTAAGNAVSANQLGITRGSSGASFPQLTAKGSTFSGMRVTAATIPAYGTVSYSTPTCADLTNTGRADLLIGNGNGNIEYWKQTAVNGLAYTKIGNLQVGATDIKVANFAKPTVCDIDGNGLLDLLMGTGDSQRIARFEQTAAGSVAFTAKTNIQVSTGGDLVTGGQFPRPAVTDLDGDGKLELLIGDYSGLLKRYEAVSVNATTFIPDAGNIQAAGANIKADGAATNGTAKPLVFDLDGNGLLDLIMGSQLGAITRYEQSARYATTFVSKGNLTTNGSMAINMGTTAGTTANAEGGYAAPLITDLDGNGRLDLLVGDANGTIYRFEQNQVAALSSSPLPVVLTAFTGQAASTGNRLSWATAQEVKSASFVVEASANGTEFAAVAELAAAGNSATARSYEYLDASATALAAARRYYRLRQVDLDGTVAYSPVVTLSRTAAAVTTAEAYPNPFAESLSVALPGSYQPQATAVSLTTLAGRPVYAAKLQLSAAPQALVALPALAPGVYVLRLITATGTITRKVTRQ